ncbi:MAG: hypothetical protein DRP01_11060, partial [Archaeoglobales archaeon]
MLWRRFVEKLREFLWKAKNVIKPSGVFKEAAELNCLADLIAFFYRYPLIINPAPGITITSDKLLLSFLLTRTTELGEGVDYQDLRSTLTVLQRLLSLGKVFEEVKSIVDDPQTVELLEEVYNKIPADTRPGFNTSGLIPHLLLTSAFSHALNRERLSAEDLAILRLAALLHDMGKPIDPEKHLEASCDLAQRILRDLVDESVLREVIYVIEEHHGTPSTKLSRALRDADIKASQVDRYNELVKKAIGDVLRKKCEAAGIPYREPRELSWDEWRQLLKVDPGCMEELTEQFCLEVRKLKDLPVSDQVGEDWPWLHVVDLRNIQGYIAAAEKLPSLKARSWVVDAVCLYALPIKLIEKGYPLEAIVVAGGGQVQVVADRHLDLQEVVDSVLKDLKWSLQDSEQQIVEVCNGLGSVVAKTKISPSYIQVRREIARALDVEKSFLHSRRVELVGVVEKCSWCYSSAASRKLGDDYVCTTCWALYELGRELWHRRMGEAQPFQDFEALRPVKLTVSELFGFDDRDVHEMLMEVLSGYAVDELRKGAFRKPNYAVLIVDANMAGTFMAHSIS